MDNPIVSNANRDISLPSFPLPFVLLVQLVKLPMILELKPADNAKLDISVRMLVLPLVLLVIPVSMLTMMV